MSFWVMREIKFSLYTKLGGPELLASVTVSSSDNRNFRGLLSRVLAPKGYCKYSPSAPNHSHPAVYVVSTLMSHCATGQACVPAAGHGGACVTAAAPTCMAQLRLLR